MQKIAGLAGRELKWVQPNAMKMRYELLAGDEQAATLHFRSSLGSFATGESGDGCWTFKRVGFFQTWVTIRTCDQAGGHPGDLAIFRNNTWTEGGTLELPNERKLLVATNFWQTRLDFKTESGVPVLQYKVGGFLHQSAKVTIEPEGYHLPELPWIVMLGWYLVVMMHSDSAAAVAV